MKSRKKNSNREKNIQSCEKKIQNQKINFHIQEKITQSREKKIQRREKDYIKKRRRKNYDRTSNMCYVMLYVDRTPILRRCFALNVANYYQR